jgi:hypothetical protein
MKSKVISVPIISFVLILISLTLLSSIIVCFNYNSSPTQNISDSGTLRLSKRKSRSENITFVGNLAGSQIVGGCCPNAGPFPIYTMTLSDAFPEPIFGTYKGHIFMNIFMNLSSIAAGRKKSYVVKFWWTEDDSNYFIDIRGGDIEENKRTHILTVTFKAVPCKIWVNDLLLPEPVLVTFILTREPL